MKGKRGDTIVWLFIGAVIFAVLMIALPGLFKGCKQKADREAAATNVLNRTK